MKHSDFVIGGSFWCRGREWRCTDIGTPTIIAICLDDLSYVIYSPGPPETTKANTVTSRREAESHGWFKGSTLGPGRRWVVRRREELPWKSL